MARRRTTGSRFKLGEPFDEMLDDFCAAHFNASATEVMRQALSHFIRAELDANMGMKERYDAARQRRLTGADANVAAIRPTAANTRPKRGSQDD